MNTANLSLKCIAIALAFMAGVAAVGSVEAVGRGSDRTTIGQTTCTPGDSLTNEWVQSILDTEISAENRHHLGLTHLEGDPVMLLGGATGDDSTCAELYNQLSAEARQLLEQPDSDFEVFYYRVGDRFLVLWKSKPSTYLRAATLISFDTLFNEIQALVW